MIVFYCVSYQYLFARNLATDMKTITTFGRAGTEFMALKQKAPKSKMLYQTRIPVWRSLA
jgi:hypothetical protein